MKKLLILMSLSALVFGCDKHDDYKNNIPEWHPTVPEEKPEEKHEYTLEELGLMDGGEPLDYRLADRFIQGYMTVEDATVTGSYIPELESYVIHLLLDGPTVSGGPYKSDPCDPGFNELADKYGDVYGPYDAIEYGYIKNKVVVHTNNIKYDVYVTGGSYDQDHPDGSSLNDIATYFFGRKRYRVPIIDNWTETIVAYTTHYPNLAEYNLSDETLIAVTDTKNKLQLPLPARAGTYSFRVVATSGGEVICDKTIENVELPARQ